MRLKKFLTKTRIVDVESSDFREGLKILLETIPQSLLGDVDKDSVLEDLIQRENAISTYLGNGVCMPHTRVKGLKQKYVFVVGRCSQGLKFNDVEEYTQTKLLFMLLSDGQVDTYLTVLSGLARIFSQESVIDGISSASDLATFRKVILEAFEGKDKQEISLQNIKRKVSQEEKMNILMLKSAHKIANFSKCSKVMVLADTFENVPDNIDSYFPNMQLVLVTEKNLDINNARFDLLNVRTFSKVRFSQSRAAIIMGLTRGIFNPEDKICCMGGNVDSNHLDTIVVIDIQKEFSDAFLGHNDMMPKSVKSEVIERVIDIATELSVEGREGKPVGSIFVIGKIDSIKPHLKQLILNPFYGYKAEDRNILNPFMDETVKEYSLIDGAVIIDGNGALEAAGALIHTPDFSLKLPGGLGARHAAAYSISLIADCMSIVISSSTGQITIFRRGKAVILNEKRRS